ncbi:MAG: ribonuclease III domain-containing protein [Bacilli bacterium]
MNYNLLSGGDLAFIGDAYYELYIREYLINKGITSLKRLHNESVKYVSRTSQAKFINILMPELLEEEIDIYKRGRNYNYKDKTSEYINASGFEALIGYLYLQKDNIRLDFFMNKIIKMVEENE